ncbi:MAG TPA: hypothetical protein VJT73_11770 [Polyangiaceae bacterium]|nr:hypothetical protein [Polyangiaceae bacterium]
MHPPVGDTRARVAHVPEPIAIGVVELIGTPSQDVSIEDAERSRAARVAGAGRRSIGHGRTVVAFVSNLVAVVVVQKTGGRWRVDLRWTPVTRVPESIAVVIELEWIGSGRTVVADVTDAVAIRIGLIGVGTLRWSELASRSGSAIVDGVVHPIVVRIDKKLIDPVSVVRRWVAIVVRR